MAIALYPHNENACLAALDMLRETGKAAVIHPTGTGKSFIGFKLCRLSGRCATECLGWSMERRGCLEKIKACAMHMKEHMRNER